MNEDLIEQEIRQFHKMWFAEYIAKVIATNYKYNENNNSTTYNQIYEGCFDTIKYSFEDMNEIYQNVDDILANKYKLIFAHNNKDEDIYLVDISDSEEESC